MVFWQDPNAFHMVFWQDPSAFHVVFCQDPNAFHMVFCQDPNAFHMVFWQGPKAYGLLPRPSAKLVSQSQGFFLCQLFLCQLFIDSFCQLPVLPTPFWRDFYNQLASFVFGVCSTQNVSPWDRLVGLCDGKLVPWLPVPRTAGCLFTRLPCSRFFHTCLGLFRGILFGCPFLLFFFRHLVKPHGLLQIFFRLGHLLLLTSRGCPVTNPPPKDWWALLLCRSFWQGLLFPFWQGIICNGEWVFLSRRCLQVTLGVSGHLHFQLSLWFLFFFFSIHSIQQLLQQNKFCWCQLGCCQPQILPTLNLPQVVGTNCFAPPFHIGPYTPIELCWIQWRVLLEDFQECSPETWCVYFSTGAQFHQVWQELIAFHDPLRIWALAAADFLIPAHCFDDVIGVFEGSHQQHFINHGLGLVPGTSFASHPFNKDWLAFWQGYRQKKLLSTRAVLRFELEK